ncbi:MAG: SRPBCC domain-containing protein [Bacteroidota bacterium]
MKYLLLTLTIMTSTISLAQNGKAKTIKKTFSRQTAVSIDINADPAIIWSLLTNASDFPRWNSTIVSLEGEIKVGQKIRLKSVLDDKRVFKIKVKEMIPEKRMVWGDGKGTRVFTLSSNNGVVTFTMDEKMGGLMFPMYAKYIPPFDENFEQFARDLKQEAEQIQKGQD